MMAEAVRVDRLRPGDVILWLHHRVTVEAVTVDPRTGRRRELLVWIHPTELTRGPLHYYADETVERAGPVIPPPVS